MTNKSQTRLGAKALNRMTTGDAALAMADLGLRLLPVCPPDHHGVGHRHATTCNKPGKVPRITDWRARATDSLSTIALWFSKYPNNNLGLLTGAATGIIAVDVDGEYGRVKLIDLLDGDIPLTWEYPTPGGGMRYLFKVTGGHPLRKYNDPNPLGGHEELAILADGQMTVLPPSRHENGGLYQWSPGRGPGDVPLADAPESIMAKLNSAIQDDKSNQHELDGIGITRSKHGSASEYDTWQETGDPFLDALSSRCKIIGGYILEQSGGGCSEQHWRYVTSMLVRAGHLESALAFSSMSDKHDCHSEQRIRDTQRESHGPTLCTTFGCYTDEILRCFGKLKLNKLGAATNSPVMLPSHLRQGRD